MESSSAQKAIQEALAGNWETAVKINLQILKSDPQDVDSLNRLARAYIELGLIPKAKFTARKALKIDSVNQIAIRCLEKLETLKNGDKNVPSVQTSESFLEEPGKTKLIPLIHPGDLNILAKIDAGDEVQFVTHPHRVSVTTSDGKYIGRLPDDMAARLRYLTKLGNSYQVLIKTIRGREVKIFIRETAVGSRAGGTPSFPLEKIELEEEF